MDSEQLIESLGGIDNIESFSHCMTRLRFNLKNLDLIDQEKAKKLKNVIGIQIKGGQLQIITSGSVTDHYKEVQEYLGENFSTEENEVEIKNKQRLSLDTLVNHLAAILSPAIPAIAGGGMLKALYFALITFNVMSPESSTAFVINMLSDTMFFYLPFLLAYTSAKRFKTDVPLAIALAGLLMYPSFLDLAKEGGKLTFLGIPILVANYKASVIPIILSVWCMSKIYDLVKKIIPASISIVLVPLLTIFISGIVSLVVLAPIGFYIADYVSVLMERVVTLSPFVSGFIIGATRPLLVLTGMHHVLSPITLQQYELFGHSAMGAISLMSTFAQASAALAFWIFGQSKEEKQLGANTAITGYIGITEPILFGILVPNKDLMLITMISGGLAGGVATSMGGTSYGFVMPGILSLPAYMGEGFNGILVGAVIAILTTLLLYGIKTRRDTL